jgi:4'-phosphopantetheinyl transferase
MSQLLQYDAVEVWIVEPGESRVDALLATHANSLSDSEWTRCLRFRFDRDRQRFLVAHTVLRVALSEHTDVDPSDWAFAVNSYGCPRISYPLEWCNLQFNISHCEGLVACALGMNHFLGIDVENWRRACPASEIARQYFSAAEAFDIQHLPEELRHRRFFEYWTLKEAYVKARAVGLTIPLDAFAFQITPDRIELSFLNEVAADPFSWQFAQQFPTDGHVMALAICRNRSSELALRYHTLADWSGAPA